MTFVNITVRYNSGYSLNRICDCIESVTESHVKRGSGYDETPITPILHTFQGIKIPDNKKNFQFKAELSKEFFDNKLHGIEVKITPIKDVISQTIVVSKNTWLNRNGIKLGILLGISSVIGMGIAFYELFA